MSEDWDTKELSAILTSMKPGLNQASHDPAFPSLSQEYVDRVRATAPNSTQGLIIRTLHDLLSDKVQAKTAADTLASAVSLQCAAENCESDGLWGPICHCGETWPEVKLARLGDLVVEMAKLPYPLPAYPYDTDEPVQGTSSFEELPGFGHELVGCMQGPKCYSLRFMSSESRSIQSMTENNIDGSIPIATRALHRNISTFAAILSQHYVRGTVHPKCLYNRGMACYSIVNALEHKLSNNEVTQNSDGSTTMPAQDWAAFRTAQPSLELPAAIEWLSVLGTDLYDGIEDSVHPAGPLWKNLGGGEKITKKRWSFWQQRLRVFSETDTILGDGMKESCRYAADRMA